MSQILYLLDTNTVSFLANRRSHAVRTHYLQAENLGARIAISTITEAEALFGLAKRPESTRLQAAFGKLFSVLEVLPWDSAAARAYSSLRVQLSATGRSLALMDLLIASHAMAVGATLVTHDNALLGISYLLKVVDWVTDL